MDEYAFPLLEFVCWSAYATFGGSGGLMSTASTDMSNSRNEKVMWGCEFIDIVPTNALQLYYTIYEQYCLRYGSI